MKVLLILIIIAVIVLIGWLVARTRHQSPAIQPPSSRPGALRPGDIAVPPPDIDTAVQEAVGPQTDEAPLVVAEADPPTEPEPVVEPLPEPDPIVEPEPLAEPEPVIEPVPHPEPEPEPIHPEAPPVDEPAFEAGTEPAGVEPAPPEPSEPEESEPEHLAEPEPEPEPVSATHGDPLAADAGGTTASVIGESETSAEHLDADAGWESEHDTAVHADPESGLYHTPDSPGFNKVGPDGVDFGSEDAAQDAGFIRWDQPS